MPLYTKFPSYLSNNIRSGSGTNAINTSLVNYPSDDMAAVGRVPPGYEIGAGKGVKLASNLYNKLLPNSALSPTLGALSYGLGLPALSKELLGNPAYGAYAASVTPQLSTLAANLITSKTLSFSPALQLALLNRLPELGVNAAYSSMSHGLGASGLSSVLPAIGTIAAAGLSVYQIEKENKANEVRLTDMKDDVDDSVDYMWRTSLGSMSADDVKWHTVTPWQTADEIKLSGDDPELADKVSAFFDDAKQRFVKIGSIRNWINSMLRYPGSPSELNEFIDGRNEVLKDRLKLLDWQKEGVTDLASRVNTGETKTLRDWVEGLSRTWQETFNPADYIDVEEIRGRGGISNSIRIKARAFFDKATGEPLHSQFGFDRNNEISKQEGSPFQNTRAELPERFNNWMYPWLSDFSSNDTNWKVNSNWTPLPDDYLFIGLPGTGKPGRWRSPTSDELSKYLSQR